jgi:hypothetical protein
LSAHHYARHLDEGRTLVPVHAYERAPEAEAIIARHGGRELRPAGA